PECGRSARPGGRGGAGGRDWGRFSVFGAARVERPNPRSGSGTEPGSGRSDGRTAGRPSWQSTKRHDVVPVHTTRGRNRARSGSDVAARPGAGAGSRRDRARRQSSGRGRQRVPKPLARGTGAVAAGPDEIGRASCREGGEVGGAGAV